ncbi:N-acetylmuramoyl-L-alanine amidase [bacterium]|nr:N-acetylmuramoyl-L-alanine amidase [bacterium]
MIIQRPLVVQNPWKPSVPSRDWRHIVIHHSASEGGSVESIDKAHKGRGWDGVGYHFVIGNGDGMGDGEIESTFRWRGQTHGAHAGNNEYNQHGIGICLIGNFDEEYPSPAQMAAVKRLVAVLKHEYGVPSDEVIAHRDVKATACPGKHFSIAEISQSVELPLVSLPVSGQYQVVGAWQTVGTLPGMTVERSLLR